jgi:hypothetical protein
VCALLSLLVVVLTSCDGSEGPDPTSNAPTNGPVQFPGADIIQRAGMHSAKGEQVLFGATTVVNKGDSTAILSAAELVGEISPSAAEVIEIRVIGLGEAPGTGDLLGASSWPARGYREWWQDAAHVDGAQIKAGEAAELVFVVKVNETGDWYWPKTALDYSVDGTAYSAVTNFGFQVCPPPPGTCSEIEG